MDYYIIKGKFRESLNRRHLCSSFRCWISNSLTKMLEDSGLKRKVEYYEMQRWFDEVQIGFGGDLITDMTQYAEDNGADHYTIEQEEFERMMIYEGYDKDVIGKSGGGWWLRTPGHEANWACIISYKGNMGWSSDSYVNFGRMGVRPAMYIEKMK